MTYGQHLILDCYECNADALHDLDVVYSFLDETPMLIGMQKIGPPQLSRFDTPRDIRGITGIIQIVTSHISIHTYSTQRCAFVDVFSCKAFDSVAVVREVEKRFGVAHCTMQTLARGEHFPK